MIQIGKAQGVRSTGEESPLELVRLALLDCHERIRRFSALAEKLAGNELAEVSDDEVREAAQLLVRYFERGLPRHVEDEDVSILPRLVKRAADGVVSVALARMHDEHVVIEALLARALVMWKQLEREPWALSGLRGGLRELSQELAARFHEHLRGEEKDVLPALTLLTEAELVTIRAEMRARRVDVEG